MSGRNESAGILPAALACFFGLLGIFFIGVVFVPLAALCALIGLVRGLRSRNLTATGLSLLAGVLCFFGFLTSPSLWLLFGLGAFMALLSSQHTASNVTALPSSITSYPTHQVTAAPTFDAALGNSLVLRMARYDDVVDKYLREMDITKSHYQSITQKMQSYLQKERVLAGNPNTAAERGQLSVAISQGSVAADQYHIQVQQGWYQYENEVSPLNQAIAAFQKACGKLPITENDPPGWGASCQTFGTALTEAKKRAVAIKAGFAELEAVYEQEHQTQENLISQSEQIE